MSLFPQLAEIEKKRESRALLLAASSLDLELLPELYNALTALGPAPRLDVILYCRGGSINAARRIALLLHEHTQHLSFIVPHHCESAATVLALSAREIVAGPLATFSPIDPQLQAEDTGSQSTAGAVSFQDVRLFRQMVEDWFSMSSPEASQRALGVLTENIFPTTLTSFYRSAREARKIGLELLALNENPERREARTKILDTLLYDFDSHIYALTGSELARLGLDIRRDADVECAAWATAEALRAHMGPTARTSLEDPSTNALLASTEGAIVRRWSEDCPAPSWHPLEPS